MNFTGIFHEAKSKYAYAFDEDTVHLRLRTVRDDLDAVSLIWGDPFHWEDHKWVSDPGSGRAMEKTFSDSWYDYWFIEVKPEFKRMRYSFVLTSGEKRVMYGAHGPMDLNVHPGATEAISEFFNFPYINAEDVFKAPDWVKDTVWYQIFPERFANGDKSIDLKGTLAWGSKTKVTNDMLFGGDLRGVIDKLDYIADLGFNGIYFTPIFEAPTTHKYDTVDYYKIDPAFGTNETFKTLVEKAHSLGIKVVLDAVFNHCGFKHPYFQDVIEKGEDSEYAQCFHIHEFPVVNFPLSEKGFPMRHGRLNYETFAFTPNMPKWRTGNPVAEKYLLDVAKYWVENYDIDGWRLDVSNEVSHEFWRKLKRHVRAVKDDFFILGENWDNSDPWLKGDQFDSVMNYEFTYPVWHLLSREPLYSDYGVEAFKDAISRLLVSYPKNVTANLFNLLDSHDTSRIRTILHEDDALVKLAFVLQMTFSGTPSVYYGSEIGLFGVNDGNRQCMVWDEKKQNLDMLAHVKCLIKLRHEHKAFKSIDLKWLDLESTGDVLGYEKRSEEGSVFCLFNFSDEPAEIVVPECMLGVQTDLYGQSNIHLESTMIIEPWGFAILK